MRRRLPLLLLLALVLISRPAYSAALPAREVAVRETDIYRSGTSRIHNLKLCAGCVVKVLRTGPVWTRVALRNGVTGNVYTSNLRATERAFQPLPPLKSLNPSMKAPLYARVVSELSAVRTAPSSETHPFYDRTRIDYAPRGLVFPVVGRKDHWLRVRLGSGRTGWLVDETAEIVPKSAYGPAKLLGVEKTAGDAATEYSFSFTRPVFYQAAEDEGLKRLTLTFFNTDGGKDGKGITCCVLPLPRTYKGIDREFRGATLALRVKSFAVDPAEPLRGLVIVLDPGHGSGYDNPARPDWGAIHAGYYEANLNLDVSTKLYRVLTDRGANVYMTRIARQVNDTFLYDRIDKARNVKADIFVSVHHNSGNSSLRGMEFYWSTNGGRALAKAIMRSCVSYGFPMDDKGIYYGSFAVTRVQEYPSALVEMGFMSNPWEMAQLVSGDYQDRQVKAIADGLEAFARSKADSDHEKKEAP